MIESPFLTVNRVIAEPVNTFDELRIIAHDAKHLSAVDRDAIRRGADELESAQRVLLVTHVQLLETQHQLIAVNDQLIQRTKDLNAVKPSTMWTLSAASGSIPIRGWPVVKGN